MLNIYTAEPLRPGLVLSKSHRESKNSCSNSSKLEPGSSTMLHARYMKQTRSKSNPDVLKVYENILIEVGDACL